MKADLWRTADLLAGTIDGAAAWAGYSMGGRMALHVAFAHPEKVHRLVLISATAGIEDATEREMRRSADNALANRIEDEGVEKFLSEWLARPLFASLGQDRAGLEVRLANTPAGLASSLRLAGVGCQAPLWARLHELRARSLPVLLIAGGLDTRYRRYAERMAAAIGPGAEILVVEGAGHACHLERPDEVAAAISEFCRPGGRLEREARCGPPGASWVRRRRAARCRPLRKSTARRAKGGGQGGSQGEADRQ